MKKSTLYFALFIGAWAIVALLYGAISLAGDVNRLEAENTELLKENTQWRIESIPAISARGWWSQTGAIRSATDITPEVLGYALNPCFTTPAGNLEGYNKDCPRANNRIKIIFDDSQ